MQNPFQENIFIQKEALEAIDTYAFYVHHGGEETIGEFNEKNFKLLKQRLAESKKTSLYTSWRNKEGKDCKTIGPVTKCFCNHRYRQHNYMKPVNRKIACKEPKCGCAHFTYVPVHGSQDFKCLGCKHSHSLHNPSNLKCNKCNKCTGFSSAWSCYCGCKYGDHLTVAETREERMVQGRFVSEAEGILMDAFMTDELKKPMNVMRAPDKPIMSYKPAEEIPKQVDTNPHDNKLVGKKKLESLNSKLGKLSLEGKGFNNK